MIVSELIKKLQQFPSTHEVIITDGYGYNFYKGEYSVEEFEDDDGNLVVDIGIGGCNYGDNDD